MNSESSRRNFLAAGLALPAAGLAKPTATPLPAQASAQKAPEKVKLTYRTLGKTGLKVTSLSFGCMTASDPSVITRAADLGIIHFDTARGYQSGNNERMLGGAIKGKRQQLVISSKSDRQDQARRFWPTWTPACENWAPTTSTSGTCTTGARRPR